MVIDLLIMLQASGMVGIRLCPQLAVGSFEKSRLEALKRLPGYRSAGADQNKSENKERSQKTPLSEGE